MLLSGLDDGLYPNVFPFTILIAKGVQFALVSVHLGSLYTRLDECVNNMVRSMAKYNVVKHVDSCFAQMFL